METIKKCIKVFIKLLISILLLSVILIVRILRPFVLIRFGTLFSARIGHYAANTELYLCEKDLGLQPKRTFDIFFNDKIVCNNQLKKMWGQILNVSKMTRLQQPLYIANSILPGSKKHVISLSSERDICNLYEQTPVHLVFSPEEEKEGYEKLYKMGFTAETKFICFHARDSSYLQAIFKNHDWSYHKYRDVNVNNLIHGLEELVTRGYYGVRMGAIVEKDLKTNNKCIIDYAKNFRTDFMDIFLIKKCYFYLGDSCGPMMLSQILRRPTVFINVIPLERVPTWGKDYLLIPKKIWLKKDHRLMTFCEILESGAGRFNRTQQYEQVGMEVVENTPEEIRDVAIEMDERLKGTWQTTEEDEELQQRFWSLFRKSELHGVIKARIGRDFLKQNKDLLE